MLLGNGSSCYGMQYCGPDNVDIYAMLLSFVHEKTEKSVRKGQQRTWRNATALGSVDVTAMRQWILSRYILHIGFVRKMQSQLSAYRYQKTTKKKLRGL
jgi:hypothetical protein